MITFITHADKRPDFIKMQYESILKNIKCDFEYVVINNDVLFGDNYHKIHQICEENSIKCVDITLDNDLSVSSTTHDGKSYFNGNRACVYSMMWTFQKYITNEEYVCIIDSDMFFIKNIDLESHISDKKIIFTPHHRPSVRYIWPGFVCLNLKQYPYLKNLNWDQGLGEQLVNGQITDVGGHTHYDIINHELDSSAGYVYEYSLYDDIKTDHEGQKYHLQLNGCVNYLLNIKDGILTNYKHIGGWKTCENKSFEQEPDYEDYGDNLHNILNKILTVINDNDVNLPSPIRISFLEMENEFIVLHYQCGSNYADFSTNSYNYLKTQEVMKILNNS
jgi:hypothetical protein